jgi:hypothetical protein
MRRSMIWSRRQQRKRAEKRAQSTQGESVEGFAGYLSAVGTASFVTAVFSPTSIRGGAVQMLPIDPARAVTQQESTRRTLEPVLTESPPLRPVRQFE